MLKLTIYALCFLCFLSGNTNVLAIEAPMEAKVNFHNNFKSLSNEEKMEIRKKLHSRIPKFDESVIENALRKEIITASHKKDCQLQSVPADLVVPAEHEELQAVLVTWPYDSYTKNGNTVEQLFENLTLTYKAGFYKMDTCYNEIDVDPEDSFASLYAELVSAIQQSAQVWINIWAAEDSTKLKDYMTNYGKPLTNYRFFINQGNSFWYRDCGPVAYYYDNFDKIGFIDFEYYGGRPLDDRIPERIASQAGFALLPTTIEYEGGNILVDGYGNLFTSDAITDLNGDNSGQWVLDPTSTEGYYVIEKTPLNQSEVIDSVKKVMNLDSIHILPRLQYDGGTGHIDLYADFFDENKFVFTKYPDELKKLTDYTISNNNVNTLISIKNYHNKNFDKAFIPLPRKNDGSWYSSNYDYETYTRTFSNHLICNNTIIQPIFHNSFSGDKTGDDAAIEEIKKAYPGYKIIQIDMRNLDRSGGSIHCITKQIPVDNPIRILHSPVVKEDYKNGKLPIYAEITNKSGIQSATVYYRKKGESNWNTSVLSPENNNKFNGNIQEIFSEIDTVEYYISATSNNGKTATKPITAPEGFYTVNFSDNDLSISAELFNDAVIYPNPSNVQANLKINCTNNNPIKILITDSKGNSVYSSTYSDNTIGLNIITINTSILSSGSYYINVNQTNGINISRLFVVNR